MPPGFDPSKMDPQYMMQIAQAVQRLPKGQVQKLQSIMQRAMLGRDVAKEMMEFQRSLPAELQTLLMQAPIPQDAASTVIEAETGSDVMLTADQTSSESSAELKKPGVFSKWFGKKS